VAEDTGTRLVRLYVDSLGEPGSEADSYIGMMRTNVRRIVEALR
jgi:ABC-type Zn uptake system ZnuABC Zn-binding protein ZnuA